MDVSSADLAAFFRAMPQLQVLKVGRELNPLLDGEVVSAIAVLPELEQLSMDLPLNESFVQDFVGSRSPAVIMPSITHLEVAFLNGHNLATATLLDGMSALKELALTLRSTDKQVVAILDPAFFSVVAALPSIGPDDVRLAASTTFPCHGRAIIAVQESMRHFAISGNQHGLPQRHGHIQLKADDLLSSPMSIKFLEAVESLNVSTMKPLLSFIKSRLSRTIKCIYLTSWSMRLLRSVGRPPWTGSRCGTRQSPRKLPWSKTTSSGRPPPGLSL